ncbi:peptide chain release factor N(5)-glutamine methyltransferase [Allorhizobium undicola]|uniref:peptide chain release factor N(5)-glutamine methyltransferase n=1 Tax=Allorhizobium undicola TaxID=78527 RepID=UPI00048281CA|nr:peptide chain release factor N(5)-glutamine methyltransferase [Allorhizobium undicola]
MNGVSLAEVLADLRRRFAAAGLNDPAMDARHLLMGLLGLSMTDLVVGGERPVCKEDGARIEAAALRRLAREPVHRILGAREFYGLTLALSAATLEPRPDTEILVESALGFLRPIAARQQDVRILDLGTGTGAIALALLKECENIRATATDISAEALATAARNAESNGLSDRLITLKSDWFTAVDGSFDMIVSNPPYISKAVIEGLEPEVRLYDPMAALDGGEDGLDAYRAIASNAGRFLRPHGHVALEIGYDQKQAVSDIFDQAGFKLAQAASDHGGNDRVLIFNFE